MTEVGTVKSMPNFKNAFRPIFFASAVGVSLALGACSAGFGGFTTVRTQGYEIPDSALQQIRPGQSEDLVVAVLGSPQTRGTFDNETVFYYVETKIEQTTFGLKTVKNRTVLAVYFDNNKRVSDKAIYTLEDGRVITVEPRRTPSFGKDRTFVEQLLDSVIK